MRRVRGAGGRERLGTRQELEQALYTHRTKLPGRHGPFTIGACAEQLRRDRPFKANISCSGITDADKGSCMIIATDARWMPVSWIESRRAVFAMGRVASHGSGDYAIAPTRWPPADDALSLLFWQRWMQRKPSTASSWRKPRMALRRMPGFDPDAVL